MLGGIGGSRRKGQPRMTWLDGITDSMDMSLSELRWGCSLKELMLRLKLQYLGHLMRSVDSLEKTPMLGGNGAGGEGDNRG